MFLLPLTSGLNAYVFLGYLFSIEKNITHQNNDIYFLKFYPVFSVFAIKLLYPPVFSTFDMIIRADRKSAVFHAFCGLEMPLILCFFFSYKRNLFSPYTPPGECHFNMDVLDRQERCYKIVTFFIFLFTNK